MFERLFGRFVARPQRLSSDDLHFILEHATIPEQIPSLMVCISKGIPFLHLNYLGFENDEWMIIVGYPLSGEFSETDLEDVIRWALNKYRAHILWVIASQLPQAFESSAQLIQSDQYYQLDLSHYEVKSNLLREVRKTQERIEVEITREITQQHTELIEQFLDANEIPSLVAALYQSLPRYLHDSPTACLINTWDRQHKLCAFFAVEQAAYHFDAHILGCFSRENYIPHASDRIFWEMIELARRNGKTNLQLGLGVNKGIRGFKEKWGGSPFLTYNVWEIHSLSTAQEGMFGWLMEGRC